MPDRLNLRSSGTADASGNVSIVFGPPPTGQVWIGSIGVTNSPATAYWSALVGGVLWGNAFGAGVAVVQAVEGEQIVFAATGLTAGNVYSAALFGAEYDRVHEYVPWAAPVPQPVATAGVSLGFTGIPASGGGGATAPTAPSGPSASTAYSVTVLQVVIAAAPGGQLAATFLPGSPANVVAWMLSVPSGGANAWVYYGSNVGAVQNGIFMPAPSFLYENTWTGSVFAISDGAAITTGMQIIRRS